MNDKPHHDRREATKGAGSTISSDTRSRDLRIIQLLHKARGGDELAIHSLWMEHGIDYLKEGGRYE